MIAESQLLYQWLSRTDLIFCEEEKIPFEITGKVVSSNSGQNKNRIERVFLSVVFRMASHWQLAEISLPNLKEYEHHCRRSGCHPRPSDGIVDSNGVALALREKNN